MSVSGFDSNCSPRTGGSKNSCDSVLGSERTLSDQTAALAANEVARSESPVLGGYEILRELGRGGMGVVYEAIQRSLGRRVALKILPGGGVVDRVTMQRFQLEAAAAARLQHPNIVSVIEVGAEHDVHFYAMQFIDGRTLLGVIADPLQAANWMLQLADALECAHRQGIVHRDIKPSNILLDNNGKVWITDFGIAKVDNGELTRTGDIPGSPRYMPPERFRGISDTRSDIYGLGISIYEVLTGCPAYAPMERESLIAQIELTDPPAPRSLNARVPRDLETIILKSIARDAETRYRTAAELAEDLRRFLQDLPILARRTTRFERILRWSRQNRTLASLAVLTPLLLLIAIGLGITATAIRRERDRAVDAETDSHIRQLLSEAANHRSSIFAGEQQKARDILTTIDASRLKPALRQEILDEFIAARMRADLKTGTPVSGCPAATALSPFADWVAEPRNSHQVSLSPCSSQDASDLLITHSVNGDQLQFGNGDRFLAIYNFVDFRGYGDDSPLPILQVYDRIRDRLIFEEPKPFRAFDCHDEAQLIAIASQNPIVDLWHSEIDGETLVGQIKVRHSCSSLKISPDGKLIAVAYSSLSDYVDLYNVSTGALIDSLSSRQPFSVAWSPDGSLLAVASENQGMFPIEVWDALRRTRISKTRNYGHQSRIHRLAFTESNSHLISVSFDGTTRLWSSWTGSCLSIQTGRCFVPAFIGNHDAAGIVVTDQGSRFLQIQPGYDIDLPFDTHHQTEQPLHLAIHPGNRLMAVGSGSDIQFFDILTQRAIGTLAAHDQTNFVAFTPDRKRFISWNAAGISVWPISELEGVKDLQLTFHPAQNFTPDRWSLSSMSIRGGSCFYVADEAPYSILELELTTGKVVREFGDHAELPFMMPTADSGPLATVSGPPFFLHLWDPDSGNLTHKLSIPYSEFQMFKVPGRQKVVICTATQLEFRDLHSWEIEGILAKKTQQSPIEEAVTFTADGQYLVTRLSPRSISIVDVETHEITMTIADPSWMNSYQLMLSSDAQRLIDSHPVDFRLRMIRIGQLRNDLKRRGFDDPLSEHKHELGDARLRSSEQVPIKMLSFKLPPPISPPQSLKAVTPSGSGTTSIGEVTSADDPAQTLVVDDHSVKSVISAGWRVFLNPKSGEYNDGLIKILVTAYQNHPDDTRLKNILGLAWCRVGRLEEAERILTENISDSPIEEVAYDFAILSMVYAKSGNRQASQSMLGLARRMRDLYPAPSDRTSERLKTLIQECESMEQTAPE